MNAWDRPKFHSLLDEINWCMVQKSLFVGPPKPPKEKPFHHAVYPYIGTSDRQRAYLVRHGIAHQRKDGEFR